MSRAHAIEGNVLLDEIAGDLLVPVAWIVVIGGLLYLAYLALKDVSVLEGLYPFRLFSSFANGVDEIFNGLPAWLQVLLQGGKNKDDQALGKAGNWINNNLPRTPSENAAVADPDATAVRNAALADTEILYDPTQPYGNITEPVDLTAPMQGGN